MKGKGAREKKGTQGTASKAIKSRGARKHDVGCVDLWIAARMDCSKAFSPFFCGATARPSSSVYGRGVAGWGASAKSTLAVPFSLVCTRYEGAQPTGFPCG